VTVIQKKRSLQKQFQLHGVDMGGEGDFMGRITSRIAAAVVLTRPGVATEDGQANATPVSSRANRAGG